MTPCAPTPTCAAADHVRLVPHALQANPSMRATGCDVSPTALRLLREAAERAGVHSARIHTFVLDAAVDDGSGAGSAGTAGRVQHPLASLHGDFVLLTFTLSAVPHARMPCMLRHAAIALRPGGLLLLRDYGRYDMAQLRWPASQMLEENLYQRGGWCLRVFSGRRLQVAGVGGYLLHGHSSGYCMWGRSKQLPGGDSLLPTPHALHR
jgi:SAM-dependent methyltransferase